MTKSNKIILISTLIFTLMSGNISAKDSNKQDPFNLEIFSLSKKKENAFDSASSIYVLTTEDLRRSGATSIPEALRLVPGLQVARIDGHKWAISARGFNGQFSNKLLVMIDGRTIYTPLFSGATWDVQDYLLEDVDKIEVIRGSGGTIWGANAVNGIINIITKNAASTQGAYASAIIGTQDKAILEARYGGKTSKNDHYRIYAKQVNRDDLTKLNNNGSHLSNEDGYRNSQAGFRYDIKSISNNKISLYGDVRQGRAKNYFDFSGFSSTNSKSHRDSKGANINANWDKTISRKSSISLNSYVDYDQFDIDVLSRTSKTFDIDFQHFYNFSRDNQFIWGLGYRSITDAIKESALNSPTIIPLNYTPDKRNDEILSAFIQEKIGIIADKLYLTFGTKFEHNDYTGGEFQPNAKLTLFPSRNQTIWASVSQAIRTPTRGEDGLHLLAGTGNAAKGSTGYESEKVVAYELGYRIKPTRKTLLDVTTFYNDYKNLRTFEGSSPSTASNLAYGRSYGAEVSAKWQVTNDWLLEAGYDFLKLDLAVKANSTAAQSTYNISGESPNNQFRLRSNFNITDNIEFDNVVYYVDSLPDSRTTTGTSPDQNGVPSYVRLDTRIGYLPNENLELSIAGQNLTDHRHQEFKQGDFNNKTEVGRSFYFKVVWQY